MASKDFNDLMDLLFNKRKQIKEFKTNLSTEETHITFKDATTFSSKEPDVMRHMLHFRQTIDSDGNYELVAYKNMEQYYRDIDFLFDEDKSKLRQASRDIAEGRYRFDFDPDELIEEFLLSNNRKANMFSKLKSEHFHIVAYCMDASAHTLVQYHKFKSKTPEFEYYHQTIEKIYMKLRNDPKFVKSYIQQKKTNDFNLGNYMTQVRAVMQHTDVVANLFSKEGMKDGIPGEQGILLLLEGYRKYAEACIKPLNFLRIAEEAANGNPCPPKTKGAEVNKAILQPILGNILDCYDPRIRNSESHLSTIVDASNSQVHFYDDRGKHELLVIYSFSELVKMDNDLRNNLFPALAFTAYMEWRTMLLLIVNNSREYKLALLKIGN